jgi:hypothetical protein
MKKNVHSSEVLISTEKEEGRDLFGQVLRFEVVRLKNWLHKVSDHYAVTWKEVGYLVV